MLKKLSIIIFILFVFVFPVAAEDFTTISSSSSRTINSEGFREKKMELRQNIAQKKEELMEKRQEVKEEMMQKREEFRSQIEKIKDEKKKEIVERITNKIFEINTNQTARLSDALKRLTIILDNIEQKGQAAKTSGENTTALEAAIKNGRASIATAQSQVDSQAAKEYTATITTESALRNVIGRMVSEFRSDLNATRKAVLDARLAVVKAHTELVKLKGGGKNNTATQSAAAE